MTEYARKRNAKLVKGDRHIKGVDMEVGGLTERWLLSVRSACLPDHFLIVKRVSLSPFILYMLSIKPK